MHQQIQDALERIQVLEDILAAKFGHAVFDPFYEAAGDGKVQTDDDYLLVSDIMQRRSQYLVHCFLYYELDEAIVSDEDYWRWCDDLIRYQRDYPVLCAELPYHELTINLGTDYSRPQLDGVPITRSEYPMGIISVALHVLRIHKKSHLNYAKFAAKYGYSI